MTDFETSAQTRDKLRQSITRLAADLTRLQAENAELKQQNRRLWDVALSFMNAEQLAKIIEAGELRLKELALTEPEKGSE